MFLSRQNGFVILGGLGEYVAVGDVGDLRRSEVIGLNSIFFTGKIDTSFCSCCAG
jgi:hypothetical protein